jgi:hypothetical protein
VNKGNKATASKATETYLGYPHPDNTLLCPRFTMGYVVRKVWGVCMRSCSAMVRLEQLRHRPILPNAPCIQHLEKKKKQNTIPLQAGRACYSALEKPFRVVPYSLVVSRVSAVQCGGVATLRCSYHNGHRVRTSGSSHSSQPEDRPKKDLRILRQPADGVDLQLSCRLVSTSGQMTQPATQR